MIQNLLRDQAFKHYLNQGHMPLKKRDISSQLVLVYNPMPNTYMYIYKKKIKSVYMVKFRNAQRDV